ncbi:GntR family transcriptional regulator [Amycolatopsis regifaucium]|uniref:GntR family transcriptional regulator n=1 Tax=Amycolatopsis regifaucium TaxID=546365 RepID=A0A154MFE0_9PSEU|nr:GntR family transcriptional regulator [Amycolatopsis regifaucium]KZB83156.1 GntR family transcriptional regulator [Amycolatopsis regifaucium]OKA03192.1 GntR family transcriptional regulator [Amycolatopsis regifaucium]SFJ47781.1 DNA-binding transcriptional regulator, GntR family [Amycolatopsis regifaucium]
MSRGNLKALAAQEIRRRIFAGELRPGTKIDQEAVAEELGISKLPVREALITLDHEGVVEHIARRGAYVAELTRDDIRDQYRVFGLVSGLAAERAAKSLSSESLQALVDLADRAESCVDPIEQERLNFEFHRRINHGSASRRLISILGILGKTVSHGFYEAHEDWPAKAREDHRRIVDALLARSGDRARTAVERHFADGAERAVALLEAQGFWDRV